MRILDRGRPAAQPRCTCAEHSSEWAMKQRLRLTANKRGEWFEAAKHRS